MYIKDNPLPFPNSLICYQCPSSEIPTPFADSPLMNPIPATASRCQTLSILSNRRYRISPKYPVRRHGHGPARHISQPVRGENGKTLPTSCAVPTQIEGDRHDYPARSKPRIWSAAWFIPSVVNFLLLLKSEVRTCYIGWRLSDVGCGWLTPSCHDRKLLAAKDTVLWIQ